MVKKKLVLYVALAALWGACGNDNESQPTAAPDGRTALTVKGEIGTKGASVSRAIDTDWGSNDKIGISPYIPPNKKYGAVKTTPHFLIPHLR